jgi:hypothetical protein
MIFFVVVLFYLAAAGETELRVLLKLQNIEELTEKFWQLSDSSSHMTRNDMIHRYSARMLE